MGILNEYEEVLVGARKSVGASHFRYNKQGNERVAIGVIKYALEQSLGWSREEAVQMLTPGYISLMKLEPMVKYINFPSDVKKDDTDYILYLLYPKTVKYDVWKYTIRVYEKVLAGKMRYPRDYQYGYLGMLRAKICLLYAINKDCLFQSKDDLYQFFASKNGQRFLKQHKLHQLCSSFYETPLEYMHDSVPSAFRDDFLYHNYMFNNLFAKSQAKKAAAAAK